MFDWIFFILAGNKDSHKAWMSSNFSGIPQLTAELAALERLRTDL